MPTLSRLQRNSSILIAAELTSRGLSFVAVLWLMNELGKAGYGPLAAAFAVANLLVMFSDFGLSSYVTRLISTERDRWQQNIKHVLLLKFLLSVLTSVVIMALLSLQTIQFSIIFWATLTIVLTSTRTFFEAVARGYQQMGKEFISKISHAIVLLGVILYGVLQHWNVVQFALGYGLSALAACIVSIILLLPQWRTAKRGNASLSFKQILIIIAPFGVSLLINAQFNYLDAVVLSFFRPAAEVAVYAAAYKPIFLITSIAGMIMNAAYPQIADLYKANPAKAKQQIQRVLQGLSLMAMGVALLGLVGNQIIIDLLYRADYEAAAVPFAILAIGVAGIYVWAGYGNSLQACGFERDYTRNFMIASVINAVITLLFTSQYGMAGAATATAATQWLLVVLMYNSYKQRL